eukprot:gene6267-6505_t
MDDQWIIPGLQNTGNTCFINAVLQALASSVTFCQHLDLLAATISSFSGSTDDHQPQTSLIGSVAAAALRAWQFLVHGPEDAAPSDDVLVTKAAQGLLTLQLHKLLVALQAVPSSGSLQATVTTTTSCTGCSRGPPVQHCLPAIDARPLLRCLATYLPEGVLEQGLQHDASEAFQQQLNLPWTAVCSSVIKSTRLVRLPAVLVLQLQRAAVTSGGLGAKLQGAVAFPLVEGKDESRGLYRARVEGCSRPGDNGTISTTRLVTFPGTHNSNAIKNDLFIAENQKLGFKQQLEAGARLFDLDYVGTEQGSRFAHCFSCFCSFASDPAEADPASVFKVMGDFLAANPRELIVIGLSNIQCGDKSAARQSLLATLAASPLHAHLATQLVDSKQRVVLLFYDAWTSTAGWTVGTKTVPSQPLLRFYGEDISIDARNAAAIDLQVGSRMTQGISNQFLAEQRSPDITWRVLGLFPSTCVVCRTGAQCGSAACAVKANSQPYVMYLLGSLSSRWLIPLGAKQQQFIPAFNGFQVDQIQVPAATGGKGIVSAAERLNKALGWLYLMKPYMASKVGLGNCVWVLDDSIYSGALICVHHRKAAIAQLLEVAAAGGGGAGRRLVIPGNSRLQVQVFAGNQLLKQYAGKDDSIQLLEVAAAVDSVQVLWP